MRSILLQKAIKAGNIGEVKNLIANGDAGSFDRYNSPLPYAAEVGNKEIVEYLLDNGLDVDMLDEFDDTALVHAAGVSKEIVELLINRGANVNHKGRNTLTPLMIATSSRKKEIVELLLASGAIVDLINDDNGTALTIASEDGSTEIVEVLVDNGANVAHTDREDKTPLMLAAQNGHVDTIKWLNQYMKNQKTVEEDDIRHIDAALHLAVENREVETVYELLRLGANVNAVDEYNRTAIMLAINGYNTELALTLLKIARHNLRHRDTREIVHDLLGKIFNKDDLNLFAEIMSKQFPYGIKRCSKRIQNEFQEYFEYAEVLFNYYYDIYSSMYKKLCIEEDKLETCTSLDTEKSDLEKTIKRLPVDLQFDVLSYLFKNPIEKAARKTAKKAVTPCKEQNIITYNKRLKPTI